MARRIDDVDLVVAIADGRILGHDRDAAFTFEVHRIHHAVDDRLVFTMSARLLQHGIDKRGLAVVDVSDNGDVAYLV